jgi:uncharacterized membrane protein YvlD (DUF360 family)
MLDVLDQILAVILFLIVVNSLKRLTMGVPARLTSWGMFLVIVNGFVFLRLPHALGYDLDPWYVAVERFIAYTLALAFNILDWLRYADLKEKGKENKQSDLE